MTFTFPSLSKISSSLGNRIGQTAITSALITPKTTFAANTTSFSDGVSALSLMGAHGLAWFTSSRHAYQRFQKSIESWSQLSANGKVGIGLAASLPWGFGSMLQHISISALSIGMARGEVSVNELVTGLIIAGVGNLTLTYGPEAVVEAGKALFDEKVETKP